MSRTRIAAVITAALILPLALSGCLRTNADVQVGPDGDLGSAVVQVGIKKTVAEKAGIMNLAGFETYIKSSKKVLPGDNCAFGETNVEYTLDCHTPDVVDNTGAFTGITTTMQGDKLILTAREGALTDDLASYDPTGEAVGTMVFYFDGDIESISAPTSSVRTPSPNVVAFDLKNGKFFHETAVVVVKSDSNDMYFLIGAAIGVALLVGLVFGLSGRRKGSNPFIDAEEGTKKRHKLSADDETSGSAEVVDESGKLRGPSSSNPEPTGKSTSIDRNIVNSDNPNKPNDV